MVSRSGKSTSNQLLPGVKLLPTIRNSHGIDETRRLQHVVRGG